MDLMCITTELAGKEYGEDRILAWLGLRSPLLGDKQRDCFPEPCPRRNVIQSAADGKLLQEDSAMPSESVSELPESIPTATACGDECRFENSFWVSEMLHPGRSWQIQGLSSSWFACHPSDGALVQQDPCFRGPYGNNRDPVHVQLDVRRCLDDLPRSRFVACHVRISMHEEQVVFRFSREYCRHLSLQRRASSSPGILYRRQGNGKADGRWCTAGHQQPFEVWNQCPVRASFAKKDEPDRRTRHNGQADSNGRRSWTPSGGCR